MFKDRKKVFKEEYLRLLAFSVLGIFQLLDFWQNLELLLIKQFLIKKCVLHVPSKIDQTLTFQASRAYACPKHLSNQIMH